MRSSLIACLFFAALCSGQQSDATVGVKGVVTDSLTKAPLPRAHVRLESAGEETRRYGAMTGSDGSFSIKGVIAGSYAVVTEKAGYSSPTGPDEGEALGIFPEKNDLRLEMAPDGWITGRVTNADGEPVEGVDLTAESASVDSRGLATTDAGGRFRIGGLAPGRYRIFATPDIPNTPPEQHTDGAVDVQDAVTWFPGSLTRRQGRTVEVAAGRETSGIDIRLVRVPIVSVSGRVEGVPPRVLAQIAVRGDGETASRGIVRADGTFRVWRLMPGAHEIEAIWQLPSGVRMEAAPVEFEIAGTNVENILLRPVPPVDVAGHIEYADDSAKPSGDTPRTVVLTGAGFRGLEFEAPVSPDGSFALTAAPPYRYRVTLAGAAGYVASMRMGGQTIGGSLLDLTSGAAAALTVRVSSATASIGGVVTDANGPVPAAQVSLIFEGEGALVFNRMIFAGPDGAYKFDGLAPGTYKLIAIGREDVFYHSVVADDYVDLTDSIEVHPNDKITHDLKRVDPQ